MESRKDTARECGTLYTHYRCLAKRAIQNWVSHSSSLGYCCTAGHLRSLKLLHSGEDPRSKVVQSEPKAARSSIPCLFCLFRGSSCTFFYNFSVLSPASRLLARVDDGVMSALTSPASSESSTLENAIPFRGWALAVSGSE